ncbi:hypothetical protein VPH35_093168 [Triticum aestivum]
MVLAVVMVSALVVDFAMVMDRDKVVIEECLDTSMDYFRMAASQPNKPTMKEDGEDEMAGWWEKAAKKLRDEDAVALKKKKEEELEKKRKERYRATNAMYAREQALVRKCEEAQKKCQKDFEERTMKLWAFAAEKEERKNKIFMVRVVKEAHLIRKREEEEEEERKKNKEKGPCSTQ